MATIRGHLLGLVEEVENLVERKALPIGTIRKWGEREYIKGHDKVWRPRTKHAHAASYHQANQALQKAKTVQPGTNTRPVEPIPSSYIDTMDAYSDANPVSKAPRQLQHLGSPMKLDQWAELMKKATPEGYNEFDPVAVHKFLKKWKKGITTVTPAREYSPAVYIRGDEATLRDIAEKAHSNNKIKADEIAVHPDGWEWESGSHEATPKKETIPGPVLRLWWD